MANNPPNRPTTTPPYTELFHHAESEIFYIQEPGLIFRQSERCVLNLATLQRVTLHTIQADISSIVYRIYTNAGGGKNDWQDLQEKLHKYCQAVRDLEYMQECSKRGVNRDPFLVMSSRYLERRILETAKLLPTLIRNINRLPDPKDSNNPQVIGGRRSNVNEVEDIKQRVLRVLYAFAGVAALLVPMLIIIFWRGETVPVVTATLSMITVAVLIVCCTNLAPRDVLTITVGYAGVMVVFVGTQKLSLGELARDIREAVN